MADAIDLTATSDEEEAAAPPAREAPAAAAAAQAPAAKRRRVASSAASAEAVDLTDEPDAPPPDVPPPWLKMSGSRRLVAEYRAVLETLQKKPGSLGALRSVWLPNDDEMSVWQMELRGFDTDLQGGRDLNYDLEQLGAMTGGQESSIIMEATFPQNYPAAPFFLRVVKPRMVMYTGHVTAGGSICVEMLTNTGTENAWQRTHTFEGIVTTVLHNMIDVEPMTIRTATGPGGRSGPLRVDLRLGPHHCCQEYSSQEAQAAFQRTLAHHKANGW